MKKKREIWLGAAVSLAALTAVLWLIDLREVWLALKTAHYGYLLLTIPCLVLFLAGRAIRWRLLLQREVPYRPVFHIQNIGYLLSMILPLRLGDVSRAVLIGRLPQLSMLQGASTLVVERLFDLLFFAALFPFTLAAIPQLPPAARSAALASGLLAVGGILLLIGLATQRPLLERFIAGRLPRLSWGGRLHGLLDGLDALGSWRAGLQLLVWSVLLWVPVALSYLLALWAVDLRLGPLEVGFVLCMAAFGVALPSSPGQLGVFQAAVFFALATVLGYPPAASLSFALLIHAAQYVTYALLGGWGFAATGQTWRGVIQDARQAIQRTPRTMNYDK